MAMGRKRGQEQQEELFLRHRTDRGAPGHPFYERLHGVLEEAQFDKYCEETCGKFYHAKLGRPSLAPGRAGCCSAQSVRSRSGTSAVNHSAL